MSKEGEEASGALWLAPESERADRQSAEAIDGVLGDADAPIASSSRPVSLQQLLQPRLDALSLADDDAPETIQGRSISFADGLACLAAASSGSEASPARSSSAAMASTSSFSSPNRRNQQSSWPGFAKVHGSPAPSCGGGDNWVEATVRAIEDMVRSPELRERERERETEQGP